MKIKIIAVNIMLVLVTLTSIISCNDKQIKGAQNSKQDIKESFGKLNDLAPIETKQFGQLVGKWACTSKDVMPDSTIHTSRATWVFKYILNGYAIEDIWIEKKEDSTNNTIKLGRDFHGKNVRIYNPQLKKWQCVWIDNRTNTIAPVWQAAYDKGVITMHDGSETWRIIFHNITENKFDWKYEINNNNKWIAISEIAAKRL